MRPSFVLSVALGLAWACGAAPLLAEEAISEEARAHFAAGVNFLQDPDGARYEDAYREFTAAYAASPSWKILGNLGIAAMKLERDGEALDAFTRYLALGGKQIDRQERAQVERDVATLKAGLVTLNMSFTPAGGLLSDERIPAAGNPVVNRFGPVAERETLGVRAGHHRISVQLEGYETSVWEFDAGSGESATRSFTLKAVEVVRPAVVPPAPSVSASPQPLPPESASGESSGSGLRTGAYASLAVGAVGLGLGTLFALRAKSKYDDANALCPDFPCHLSADDAARRSDLADSGSSAKTLSVVGFVTGGLGIAAGATLFVLSGKSEQKAGGVRWAPLIGVGQAALRGSF